MSVKIMARVWAHSQQSGGGLLVMLALADFANDAGECWPSIPVLAEKSRLSDREVQYLLPKLEQDGELRRIRSSGGRNRASRYVVTVTENGAKISVKKLHRKRETVKFDAGNGEAHFTRIEPSGTINKRKREPNGSSVPAPHSGKKKSRLAVGVPDEIKPAVERIVARINELAGTSYAPDSKILNGLVARLKGGATEADCLAVVENQWREWGNDSKMRKYFNPETLFRESKFEKYRNAAAMGRPNRERFWA